MKPVTTVGHQGNGLHPPAKARRKIGVALLRPEVGYGPAGEAVNLQRPLQALGVVRMNDLRRGRIHGAQLLVKSLPSPGLRLGSDGPAQLRIGLGQIGETFPKCSQIHHGAAHHDGHATRRPGLLNEAVGIGDELRSRVWLFRVTDVDQSLGVLDQALR